MFEKFRSGTLKSYILLLSHCLSVPALCWDAVLLNITKSESEIITDACIHLFFENGMRREVSYISKIYSKGNNKYLKSYDPILYYV